MSLPSTFFDAYFEYVDIESGEAPANIHRWCAISLIGTLLGRQFYFPFGREALIPNNYIQIIGLPASRKSTAIKTAAKLLKLYGYDNFAPQKLSMGQFLIELHDKTWGTEDSENGDMGSTILEDNLFGTTCPKTRAAEMNIAELYVASDEFVDFIGRNNTDFISLLGTFWDYKGVYDYKLKNSKAVYINEPTINIIAGNTPLGFNQAFPAETKDQGFFSRLLLIHAKTTGRKIAWPGSSTPETLKSVIDYMSSIQTTCVGEATMSQDTRDLCEYIYHTWEPLADSRFEHYSGRRHTHLLKLSLICAAMRVSKDIGTQDVILANTILTFAEYEMPMAMGEFGKGKNSALAHKILEVVNKAVMPITMTDLIKQIHNDIDNLSAVAEIIRGLTYADKLQIVDGVLLPKRVARAYSDSSVVKPSLLLAEELRED